MIRHGLLAARTPKVERATPRETRMQHYERLQRLASEGDTSAASALRQEAARRADALALALSNAALGERSALIAEASAAWARAAWERLDAFSSALGLLINQDTAQRIDALIQAANKRLKRRVTHAHVLTAISEALTSETPFSALNTGYGSGGARSVVVLAVRNPDHTLTLGVASAPAQSASPGAAWPDELRPWRPEQPSTQARLNTWSANNEARDRVRLPRPSQPDAATFNLLTRALPSDANTRAWSDKVYKASRGPLTRAKWRKLCHLLQDPADPKDAEAFLDTFRARPDLASLCGDAAWLKDAFAVGDKARPHWHLTRGLSLEGPSVSLLTRTCAAMSGLEEVFLDCSGLQDPDQHTQIFAGLCHLKHLSALNHLYVWGAQVSLEGAHFLWGDKATKGPMSLRRLVLNGLRAVPALPWPLLQRPLAKLSLMAHQDAAAQVDLEGVLCWLRDSPVRPEDCAFFGRITAPVKGPLLLPDIKRLTLHVSAEIAEGATALVNSLSLPDLASLTVQVPNLSEPLIEALCALRDRLQHLHPSLCIYVNQDLISRFVLQCENLDCFAPQPWHVFRASLLTKLVPRWNLFP